MHLLLRLIVFTAINFSALGVGTFLMGDAVTGEWYQSLNKAPWTPPGWVFGAAWTSIMLAFSIFMTAAFPATSQLFHRKNPLAILFWVQWVLNISWNYLFFNQQLVLLGLIDIVLLTVVVWAILFSGIRLVKYHALWVLPYGIWLLVAASLNAYILLNNP